MHPAYVDKLAEDNKGVKYSLVRQDLFDRTVDAKQMKTKDSKETVKTFSKLITTRRKQSRLSKLITTKKRPKKIWVDQGTEFAGEFKKFCSAEGKELYNE